MWWIIGIVAYLCLLSLGLIFLCGASKLEDINRQWPDNVDGEHPLDWISRQTDPHQLPLPFMPPVTPSLRLAQLRLTAALLGKFFSHF